jgi:lipoprotein-anchoring transpeptidase ErfK/SrfK
MSADEAIVLPRSSPIALGAVDAPRKTWLRRALAGLVAVQLLVGLIAAAVVAPTRAVAGSPAVVAPQMLVSEPGPSGGEAPGESAAADALGPAVPLFESAGAAQPFKTLTNPTWEGVPLVLHVLEDGPEWLHVRVNIRPNGTTAWVRRSDVSVRPIANRIVVELGDRRLTVLHGNTVLAQHRVAIGAPDVPTPTGEFYVDATVHIANPGGPYGAGQLSVSGFSNVLHSFGGGIGQIAIHGTNNPSAIGGTVSHGCIRMLNDAWKQVAELAPNGTPVSIRP